MKIGNQTFPEKINKICLIRPPIVVPANNQTSMFTPPLGLTYVAGTLRAAGHDVSLIDAVGESLDTHHSADNDCFLYGLSLDETVERIAFDAKIIGIACGFSFEWPTCRDLIGKIRKRFPDALLLGGGEHVTAVPVPSLEESTLDIGVLGEGEETALEVVNAFCSFSPNPSCIEGIAYKNEDARRCPVLRFGLAAPSVTAL